MTRHTIAYTLTHTISDATPEDKADQCRSCTRLADTKNEVVDWPRELKIITGFDRTFLVFFFLMMRPPPSSTLFPSTPLFRSRPPPGHGEPPGRGEFAADHPVRAGLRRRCRPRDHRAGHHPGEPALAGRPGPAGRPRHQEAVEIGRAHV